MSQLINAILSGASIAVNDMDTEPAETAVGFAESEAVRDCVTTLWEQLKENGGNEEEGPRLFLDWRAEMIQPRKRRVNKSEDSAAYGALFSERTSADRSESECRRRTEPFRGECCSGSLVCVCCLAFVYSFINIWHCFIDAIS